MITCVAENCEDESVQVDLQVVPFDDLHQHRRRRSFCNAHDDGGVFARRPQKSYDLGLSGSRFGVNGMVEPLDACRLLVLPLGRADMCGRGCGLFARMESNERFYTPGCFTRIWLIKFM
jgi:hypothetical protein